MKRENKSPWIHQLDSNRTIQKLTSDVVTDVVIVGGGIAGIATAYWILKQTDKKVVILEGYKIAHGATGHNAGQITSYFERPFFDLVKEFGLQLAAEGQKAIESAWRILDEMYTTAGMDIPVSRFVGHAGLSGLDQVIHHLENNRLRKEAGISVESIYIAEDAGFDNVPPEYVGLYTIVSRAKILELIESEDKSYCAVVSYQKGCMNSALFVQETVRYLLEAYKDRFSLYEYAQVNKVLVRKDRGVLDVGAHVVEAGRVILCTNGFDHFTIVTETGLDVNARFHHRIDGVVGYMSGYLEAMNKMPTAISYFPYPEPNDPESTGTDSYFYLTRRGYEVNQSKHYNLISIGGPGAPIEHRIGYSRDAEYPEEISEDIDAFVKKTYDTDPNRKIDYIFTWHGLMGYTKNGLRMIGPDPVHPVLMYNLGCNGVGILPSLYGAARIADGLAGKEIQPSIFDVKL